MTHLSKRPWTAAAVAVALATAVATPAAGQSVCAKHADFAKFLESQHQEVVAAVGLAGTGTMVEIFVSKAGSWTLAATNTEGVTCMVMAGENFEMLEERDKLAQATGGRIGGSF